MKERFSIIKGVGGNGLRGKVKQTYEKKRKKRNSRRKVKWLREAKRGGLESLGTEKG